MIQLVLFFLILTDKYPKNELGQSLYPVLLLWFFFLGAKEEVLLLIHLLVVEAEQTVHTWIKQEPVVAYLLFNLEACIYKKKKMGSANYK